MRHFLQVKSFEVTANKEGRERSFFQTSWSLHMQPFKRILWQRKIADIFARISRTFACSPQPSWRNPRLGACQERACGGTRERMIGAERQSLHGGISPGDRARPSSIVSWCQRLSARPSLVVVPLHCTNTDWFGGVKRGRCAFGGGILENGL